LRALPGLGSGARVRFTWGLAAAAAEFPDASSRGTGGGGLGFVGSGGFEAMNLPAPALDRGRIGLGSRGAWLPLASPD
jgi:hypothetical protein